MTTEKWDGRKRRMMNQEDHDLLTRIDTNLTLFMNEFKEHEKLDDERFMWAFIAVIMLAGVTGAIPQILSLIKS